MRDGPERLRSPGIRAAPLTSMFVRTVIDIAVPLITIVLMAVVGTDLRLADFRRLFRRSRLVWAGLVAPPLVLPPIALGLITLMRPPLPIATGLLLIAACPVGGISNAFSYLARAATALSVTLTAMSCLLATITMPAISAGFASATRELTGARVPISALVAQLVFAIGLPVTLGMVARSRWPEATARVAPVMYRIAFVLLFLLLGLVILADVRAFVGALPHAVPLAGMFVAASFLVGGGIGHILGGDRREQVTLAIEFATRNVAVATMIAVTVLGRVEFATFATAYFLTELPLMTATAFVIRYALEPPSGAPARVA